MKSKIFILVLIVILFSCYSEKGNNKNLFSLQDDLGYTVSFKETPKRIITLAPNLTEFVYDLKLDSCLIANTIYCNYPPDANYKEKIGDLLNVNFEKIIALKPDLIFITVEGNLKETYNKLKELGLKVFVSNPRNIEGIQKTYLDIAKIFNRTEFAKIKINKWDSLTNKISNFSSKYKKSTAMYIVEIKPIMVAGENTFINEFMKKCNLRNIAEGISVNYPILSREEILRKNPEYIIFPQTRNANIEDILKIYPEWKDLKAIKNNNIIFVNQDLFSRPGPRYVNALVELFTLLHPQEKDIRFLEQ